MGDPIIVALMAAKAFADFIAREVEAGKLGMVEYQLDQLNAYLEAIE